MPAALPYRLSLVYTHSPGVTTQYYFATFFALVAQLLSPFAQKFHSTTLQVRLSVRLV